MSKLIRFTDAQYARVLELFSVGIAMTRLEYERARQRGDEAQAGFHQRHLAELETLYRTAIGGVVQVDDQEHNQIGE